MKIILLEKQIGFTLIEVLMIIGIIAILAFSFLLQLNFFKNQNALDLTAQEIISALRLSQNKTLASESASSFGVHFDNNKFVAFKGFEYNPASSDNEPRGLLPSISISNINLTASSTEVVFERLTGNALNAGSIDILANNNPATKKTIYISGQGTVSLTADTSSDATRLKDSRHAHVLFSQNTQNAAILILNFPADGVNQNINYQDFLNAAKDQFDWSGTITVNGTNQTLRIHSHSLTDSATLFCVHRDRRYNSKAINISLDSQNLINYSAAGITTQGASAWAGQPQLQ